MLICSVKFAIIAVRFDINCVTKHHKYLVMNKKLTNSNKSNKPMTRRAHCNIITLLLRNNTNFRIDYRDFFYFKLNTQYLTPCWSRFYEPYTSEVKGSQAIFLVCNINGNRDNNNGMRELYGITVFTYPAANNNNNNNRTRLCNARMTFRWWRFVGNVPVDRT
jgi:hypothetical protein